MLIQGMRVTFGPVTVAPKVLNRRNLCCPLLRLTVPQILCHSYVGMPRLRFRLLTDDRFRFQIETGPINEIGFGFELLTENETDFRLVCIRM